MRRSWREPVVAPAAGRWFAGALALGLLWLATSAPSAASQTVPYSDPNAVGSIGLCDSQGHQFTEREREHRAVRSGEPSRPPPAAGPYAGPSRTAILMAYQPIDGLAPSDWSGDVLTASSRYSNPANPMAAATGGDESLAGFMAEYSPKWDGILQLRMYLDAANEPEYSLHYPVLDIQVTGSTWHALDGGPVNCHAGVAESIETMLLPASKLKTPPGSSSSTTTPGSTPATTGGSKTPTSSSGAAAKGGHVLTRRRPRRRASLPPRARTTRANGSLWPRSPRSLSSSSSSLLAPGPAASAPAARGRNPTRPKTPPRPKTRTQIASPSHPRKARPSERPASPPRPSGRPHLDRQPAPSRRHSAEHRELARCHACRCGHRTPLGARPRCGRRARVLQLLRNRRHGRQRHRLPHCGLRGGHLDRPVRRQRRQPVRVPPGAGPAHLGVGRRATRVDDRLPELLGAGATQHVHPARRDRARAATRRCARWPKTSRTTARRATRTRTNCASTRTRRTTLRGRHTTRPTS